MRSGSACVALVLALCTGACRAARNAEPLPAPESPRPVPPAEPTLRAGFARVDITPPPGPGLMGFGPEGRRARGYRQRIHARALVMEDRRGERLAIVVVDLLQTAPILHRRVAARTLELGIGADRLILAATHTHSGPGNMFAIRAYDKLGSMVKGYDPSLLDFFVERIARAVARAADSASMRRARAAWGVDSVWGLTRNRSLVAFERNHDAFRSPFAPPPRLSPAERSVDPTWAMLRVDLLDAHGDSYRPAGALSVFAIHSTVMTSGNELIDGDVHAMASRAIEWHIDSRIGPAGSSTGGGPLQPRGVHLMANGAQGDMAPLFSAASRCPLPALLEPRRPRGPHAFPSPLMWLPREADAAGAARCVAESRSEVKRLGAELASRAIALFDALGSRLSSDIELGRAFATFSPLRAGDGRALCRPQVGTGAVPGAEGGWTRLLKWRWFGLFESGLDSGLTSVQRPPTDCQGAKRVFLGPFQPLIAGELGAPTDAQLTVARIGPMLLGTIPAEATITAGWHMRRAMAAAAAHHADSTLLVGLANGYISYAATADEYELQRYESASTLFGPGTARALADHLATLAGKLARGESGVTHVSSLIAFPGRRVRVFRGDLATAPPVAMERTMSVLRRADAIVARFTDRPPGGLIPADGPVLVFEERRPDGGWEIAAWDDSPDVEVRLVRPCTRAPCDWEGRWFLGDATRGALRVRLLERRGLREVVKSVP